MRRGFVKNWRNVRKNGQGKAGNKHYLQKLKGEAARAEGRLAGYVINKYLGRRLRAPLLPSSWWSWFDLNPSTRVLARTAIRFSTGIPIQEVVLRGQSPVGSLTFTFTDRALS